jgi:hypothetical protein
VIYVFSIGDNFPFFVPLPEKMTLILVFWQGLRVPDGINRWQNTARFKGPYKPIGEVQICGILANRAIIKRILHRN